MNGKLIVIEGLDGCGKTLQTGLLAERLTAAGHRVRTVSFPDYQSDSSKPLQMYLGGKLGSSPSDVNAYAASSLFAVDRFISYRSDWIKDHQQGSIIIANRYTTANAFHQMCKLPRDQWDGFIDWLFDYEYRLLGIPRPDHVIMLYMDQDVSSSLLSKRYGGDETKRDIHESSASYLADAAECAMYAANHCGWTFIKCSADGSPLPIEDISQTVWDSVVSALSLTE